MLRRWIQLVVVLGLFGPMGACVFDEARQSESSTAHTTKAPEDVDTLGTQHLEENRIAQAREHFEAVSMEDGARWANAQVGQALTRLMLLPEHDATTLALTRLGADPARLPLRTSALVGVGGVFERMADGAGPDLVRDALYAALPWDVVDLESGPGAVFAGLDAGTELEVLREPAEAIDAELAVIVSLLESGLDAGVEGFVWPRGLMHSPRSYRLRRSELALLASSLHALRASLNTALAYRWPMSARAALGSIDGSGETLSSEALAMLWNLDFIREASAESERHHASSREAWMASLAQLRSALTWGIEEEREQRFGPIRWMLFGESGARELDRMLSELEASFEGPVVLSFSDAAGRTLSAEPLFSGVILRTDASEAFWVVDADAGHIVASPEAIKAELLDVLFTPSFLPEEVGPAMLGSSTLREISLTVPGEGLRESLAADYNF